MAKNVQLTPEQRDKFAEKFMDWGNLVFAGLVVAQIVPGTSPFRPGMYVVGLTSITGAYLVAYLLMRGGE